MTFFTRWLPVMRALVAQVVIFLSLAILATVLPLPRPTPLWIWALLQGLGAALLVRYWKLGLGWQGFQLILPFALGWQLNHPVAPWIYPVLLGVLVLVFGGGVLTRVPLYNSGRGAWRALLELLPEIDGLVVADLGAGLGGPLQFLARKRPSARFVGVEASPLVWLVAWVRTLAVRKNCEVKFGNFWDLPLGDYQVVYAFLSPIPMPKLWAKACREMPPGSLLISNTFEIPEVLPERRIPLPGRRNAYLLVYRLGNPSR